MTKFRVQAIREDGLVVEEARELALASSVAAGTASLQLVFAWPSGEPQRLKFRLAATDSTFAGPWSAETNTVTVGEWCSVCSWKHLVLWSGKLHGAYPSLHISQLVRTCCRYACHSSASC